MAETTAAKPRFRRYASEERREMLIDAGITCLSRGGILAFTIDNICREAGASRGLITYHFTSKDRLLAAVYSRIYGQVLDHIAPPSGHVPFIEEIVEAIFQNDLFTRASLNIWLAVWGEIATNPDLAAEHRRNYAIYRDGIIAALQATAGARRRGIDAEAMAVTVIALIDGLWIEQCIDPGLMSAERAKATCYRVLEPHLGPFAMPEAVAG